MNIYHSSHIYEVYPNFLCLHDYPGTSGGAIYHTGYLRLSNTSFVANEVGIEGPAIISIGILEEMSNVYFSENTFDCRAGEYGYIDKDEVSSVFLHHGHMQHLAKLRTYDASTLVCTNYLLVGKSTTCPTWIPLRPLSEIECILRTNARSLEKSTVLGNW